MRDKRTLADPVAETFVEEIEELSGKVGRFWRKRGDAGRIDRIGRLLAYVRLRQSEALVELAKRLVGKRWSRGAVRWHCMEILLRNGVGRADLPKVWCWDRVRIDVKTGVCLVWVPAGEFRMGYERPVHRVMLCEGYWMGKYAVTNREYGRYVEAGGAGDPEFWHDVRFNVWDQPVVGVSWEDARGYCEWAGFELPSEVEWEYGCLPWDGGEYLGRESELLKYCAWCGDLDYSFYYNNEEPKGSAHGVGLKRANARGLFDIYGNVWEWCLPWYGTGVPKWRKYVGRERELRGGSWSIHEHFCTPWAGGMNPDIRDDNWGFRVICRETGASLGTGGGV